MGIKIFKTDEDLKEMIKGYRGVSFATIEMVTKANYNKKSRLTQEPYEVVFPKGVILCASRRFVTIGNNYEQAVNNRRIKETLKLVGTQNTHEVKEWMNCEIDDETIGDCTIEKFKAESLPWGHWLELSDEKVSRTIIEHKGNLYIRIYYLNSNSSKSEKFYHYENGDPISDELIERLKNEFLPLEKKSEKQGVDEENQVIVNNPKLSGIVRLHFSGNVYIREEFASGEELRNRVSEVLMNSKVAGNPAITLKDIYNRLNINSSRDKSKVRWILTDYTCFKQDKNGLFAAC